MSERSNLFIAPICPSCKRIAMELRRPLDYKTNGLRKAIMDEGSHPSHHRQVMARHRREWPVLWKAIDQLVTTTKGDK